MQHLACPEQRKEGRHIAFVSDLAHETVHVDSAILPGRIALPGVPLEIRLFGCDLLRPVDTAFEIPGGGIDVAVEIGQHRYPAQELADQEMEFETVRQMVAVVDPRGRKEVQRQDGRLAGVGRCDIDGERLRDEGFKPFRFRSVDSGAVFFRRASMAAGERRRVHLLLGDGHQLVLPAAFAEADVSQLVEGVDEVGQIIDGLADEGQPKGQLVAGLVAHPPLRRRFDDEGVGDGEVLAHDPRIGGRRRFKDVGIDAPLFEDAVGAFLFFQRADDPLEGVAESTPQGGALIGRQNDRVFGLNGQLEFADFHLCLRHDEQPLKMRAC